MIKSHSGLVKAVALLLCAAVIITSFCLGNIGLVAEAEGDFGIKYNSRETEEVTLAQDSKILLTVDEQKDTAYKWQISVDRETNSWADISGQRDSFIYIGYATVGSLLDSDGRAYIRCIEVSDGRIQTSSPVAVTVTYTVPETYTEETPVKAAKAPVLRAGAAGTEQCTVTVNFVYENGDIAYEPWVATVEKGTGCDYTVKFPTVVGYLPYFEDSTETSTEYTFNIDAVNEDLTYNVTYKPTVVKFKVHHLLQNVLDDHYTLYMTTEEEGLTGSPVGDKCDMDMSGFTMLYYDKDTKIAADGSTEIEVYYDRNYYLVAFALAGGYGVDPIYARYETTVSVGKPTRAGYVFAGWELIEIDGREATADEKNKYTLTNNITVPFVNLKYTAKWQTTNTSYTVVYWAENADDDGYSFITSKTVDNVESATVVSGTHDLNWATLDADNSYKDKGKYFSEGDSDKDVTVEGDGSTVVNVRYKRNRYTLTFVDGTERVLICTKTEHTHSSTGSYRKGGIIGIGATTYYVGGCYPAGNVNNKTGGAVKGGEICGLEEHTHSTRNGCYTTQPKVVATITAKYGEDIHGNFPIKDGDETIWWTVPSGTETFETGNWLGSIDTMPGENITFNKYDSESGAVLYYYVETLNGEEGDTKNGGKNYKLYKRIDLNQSGVLTYKEEFHDIKGFEQGDSNPKLTAGGSATVQRNNYLYYTRKSYTLKFFNRNGYVDDREKTVQYEAPLKDYNFTPDYPAGLEPNAFEFAGWYTTPQCFDGSEVNFDTATMPDSDVTLYAKWAPKSHMVNVYKTSAKTELLSEQQVLHGSIAKAPENFTNGEYVFSGWFYIDTNGETKAFDFNDMPINRDMEIFAEWSSKKAVVYTIYYKDKDGNEIADPTVGTALAGTSRTFDAKGGNELYQGYQEGYFPNTNSHTILMDIDASKNEFTFYYEQKENMPYTVRYLEAGTGKVLADEEYVETNRKSVVTRIFKQISGYMPDAYQKRLVLSLNAEENVITFWYTADDEHAYYMIIHYVQNLEGDGYTVYRSVQGPGKIGDTIEEKPLNLTGYTYNEGKSKASGEITEKGLQLELYYDRNEYPYTVKYLEYGTNKELHEQMTSTEKYRFGKVVYEPAVDIPGYTVYGDKTKSRTIGAGENVIIFYYTEQEVKINYVPVGEGTVSISSETVKAKTGNADGSTPAAKKGYRFDGWFTDEACTVPANSAWVDGNNKLVPQKNGELYEEKTYYAKFSEDTSTLTIIKSGSEDIDENQTFIFNIKGADENTKNIDLTVTVHGNSQTTVCELPVGEYTVEEDISWSWRYKPDKEEKTVNVVAGGTNVTFENKRTEEQWLNGDNYSVNIFK